MPDDYCPKGSDKWFTIPNGLDKGKKLFYYDYTTKDAPIHETVLFVHGNPECSYTYRHIIDTLNQSAVSLRIIALDNIGCGLSDQASFEMVDMHHAANLKALIEHLNLSNITLVVHDWGGPIGIGAFLNQMYRVDKLVVLNSTVFPMPAKGITYANWPLKYLSWSRFGSLIPNFLWGGVAAAVLKNANKGSLIKLYSRAVYAQLLFVLHLIPKNTPGWVFSEPFRTQANAKSSKRNVLQTPYWGYGYEYKDKIIGVQSNIEFYRQIQSQLPLYWGNGGVNVSEANKSGVNKNRASKNKISNDKVKRDACMGSDDTQRNIPVVAHFGDYDPCGKPEVIEQWCEALPSLRNNVYVYKGYGHFIEEFKGKEIADSILKLNADGKKHTD